MLFYRLIMTSVFIPRKEPCFAANTTFLGFDNKSLLQLAYKFWPNLTRTIASLFLCSYRVDGFIHNNELCFKSGVEQGTA